MVYTATGSRADVANPRAVGYVRVSTLEQAREGISLDAQEARIRAYAAAKDLDLAEVLRDEGLSGKDLDRPGVQRLIAACQAGEVGAVIVAKLDRLSRRTRDLLNLVEDVFQAHNVALHSLHETVDTSCASGRFFLRIMGALAEMERELIGERTAAALAHKRALGERLGTTPLGYRTPRPPAGAGARGGGAGHHQAHRGPSTAGAHLPRHCCQAQRRGGADQASRALARVHGRRGGRIRRTLGSGVLAPRTVLLTTIGLARAIPKRPGSIVSACQQLY